MPGTLSPVQALSYLNKLVSGFDQYKEDQHSIINKLEYTISELSKTITELHNKVQCQADSISQQEQKINELEETNKAIRGDSANFEKKIEFTNNALIKYSINGKSGDLFQFYIDNNTEKLAESMIENGFNIDANTKDKNNKTLLHFACQQGKKDIVEYLIEKGADVNKKDNDGWTAMHYAFYEQRKEIVDILKKHGAEQVDFGICDNKGTFNTVSSEYISTKWCLNSNCTFLHHACYKGKKDVVEYLVGKGADIHAKDRYNFTPLHWACSKGDKDTVEYLVRKGANLDAKNDNGKIPAECLSEKNKEEIRKYLVEKGHNELSKYFG